MLASAELVLLMWCCQRVGHHASGCWPWPSKVCACQAGTSRDLAWLLSSMFEITCAMQMKPSGKGSGPPPAVKKLLSMFGSQREEDRMVGYLSFLKIGPQLLRFLPGERQP